MILIAGATGHIIKVGAISWNIPKTCYLMIHISLTYNATHRMLLTVWRRSSGNIGNESE
jgi:hypothetical protein